MRPAVRLAVAGLETHPARRSMPHMIPELPTLEAVNDELLILIPCFNDWPALAKLLPTLERELAKAGISASVLVVDDGSTDPPPSKLLAGGAIARSQVLELRRNLGHQRAIAIGLAYVEDCGKAGAVVVMDGDGEDDPADVPRLIAEFRNRKEEFIVFAERTRRSESRLFVVFYKLYKILHVLMTGYHVRVGNFSVVPRRRLTSLVVVAEMWIHYAAAVFKSRQPYTMIPTHRAKRLDGKSSMNFVGLVAHGLSAISVYSETVAVRLLVVAAALIIALSAALAGIAATRLLTPISMPNWAGATIGVLSILLFQVLMISLFLCFVLLGNKHTATMILVRDYRYFIKETQGDRD